MLTKEICLAYPTFADFDGFKVSSINHGTTFKGNTDFDMCCTIKSYLTNRWYLCFHGHQSRNQNATSVMRYFYFDTLVDH